MQRLIRGLALAAVLVLPGPLSAQEGEPPEPPELEVGEILPPSLEREVMFRILAAELAGKRGDLATALGNYLAAAHGSDDPRVAERAFSIALYLRDDLAALDGARRWRTLAPEDSGANQALAVMLLRVGAWEESLEQLVRLQALAVDDGQEGLATVSGVMSQVEDKDRVLAALDALRQRQPENRFTHYYHGLTALGLGLHDVALASLDDALELDPDWVPGHLLRTQILLDTGDEEGALAYMGAQIERLSGNAELHMGYGRMLAGMGHWAEAAGQFRVVLAQDAGNTDALFGLAISSMEAKDFDTARDAYLEVLCKGERVEDTYIELGRLEEAAGNYAEARDWFNRVPRGERYLPAQIRVGAMTARLGDLAGMSAHLAALRAERPAEAMGIYLAEAQILRELDEHQETFDVLTAGLEEFPGESDLLYARALAAERLDRLDLLEADLRQILEQDPEHAHALNALGYTLADRTDRFEEALDYITRALEMLPEDPAVLDSMGWVLFRLDDPEGALGYLRQAYELSQDGEIAAHLVEVLMVLGEETEARDIWQQGIEDHPEDRHLRDVQQRFGL